MALIFFYTPVVSTLSEKLQQLIHTCMAEGATWEQCHTAATSLHQSAIQASPEERQHILDAFAPYIARADFGKAAILAMVAGSWIERGANAQPLKAPLLQRLRWSIPRAARLWRDQIQPMSLAAGGHSLSGSLFARLNAEDPEGVEAWQSLEQFQMPAIALLSASVAARLEARDLDEPLRALAPYHRGAGWILQLLRTPVREPLLVLEPSSGLGIEASLSGTTDNFQMHMLLMGHFPQVQEGLPRISPEALSVAEGWGPVALDKPTVGVWNFYPWHAWTGTLEVDNADSRIPGDGNPLTIPLFEGRRTLLLGPSSDSRAWETSRAFPILRANLEIENRLSTEQVRAMLDHIAQAQRS